VLDYDFAASLLDFIKLGAEIIDTKPSRRYGWQFSDERCLQPGFMPVAGPPKLVYIGINPSTNEPISALESTLYKSWASNADLDAYRAAYDTWAYNNVSGWTVFRTVQAIFKETGHSPRTDDLGWLNIAKVPDSNSASITADIASRDLPWLKRQLQLMGPDIFIVLGTNSSRYSRIQAYLEREYGSQRVAIRGQRGQGESLLPATKKFSDWIRALETR
jgi:hypothetical protein